MTQQATAGNTVRVHYVGTLDNGERFDTSVGGDPLEFTLGAGQVIPGFEEAISGMEVGETKQVGCKFLQILKDSSYIQALAFKALFARCVCVWFS